MTTLLKTKSNNNLLGLDKPPNETKVVVAMSGGVDSSVVAGLMKMNGYQVIGMTLQLYDYAQINKKPGTCCAGQDIYDAKRVSEKLDIDHYVLNYESKFKNEVIEKFADSYLRGETPIPCVNCNQTVKFRDLFESAKNLKADALITGHYVKKIIDNKISKMYRPKDLNRDQTYFLFATTQEQLNYLHFPLGDLPKEETRNIAKKLNLEVADKPDSQDICFVPNLGKHEGIINFTIGQRKGIKISGEIPYYVIKINPKTKEVIIGKKEELEIKRLKVEDINYLSDKNSDFNEKIFVKVRSTGKLIESKLDVNTSMVSFEKSEYGVSPGQACVFYKPDQLGVRVLGGGWIRATE
ncbi:MAG: tRNA-specific 2-thiouridylase [Candidatus Fonsibacter ubiquis]|nr:tRNA-specific 2-thiouridylase [Candidatus Fonsibacter ubiquis]